MDKIQILEELQKEQYPEFMIENTIKKIENMNPEIKEALFCWIDKKECSDLIIAGYSFSNLVERKGMKPIGAFLTLDWLTREPEKAKAALKRKYGEEP